MRLNGSDIDFFRTHGYLALPDLFPQRHAAALRGRLEELCAAWDTVPVRHLGPEHEPAVFFESGPAPSADTVRRFADLAREEALFYAHARNGVLLDVVEQLLGLPLALYSDQALLKPPRIGSERAEHQDQARFNVEPPDHFLTCWTALDDASPENGCVHYYPGSHLGGALPHQVRGHAPEVMEGTWERGASVPVPLRAGGCVLHHPLTVHWSPANHTERWRRAFVCRFVRADAVMGARERNAPPLIPVRD